MDAGEIALVLRLEPVVELLQKPLAHDLEDPPRVEPVRSSDRHEAPEQGHGAKVALQRAVYTRVLHLDRNGTAVRQTGAMNLPDRSAGEGLASPLGEEIGYRGA